LLSSADNSYNPDYKGETAEGSQTSPIATPSNVPAWAAAMGIAASVNTSIPVLRIERTINLLG
jgi:hypothetical protein